MELVKKEKEVYEFIKNQIELEGYPPSVREICAAVGLSSPSTVQRYINSLEEKGYIVKGGSKKRAITLPKQENEVEVMSVPIVGTVAAGQPILAVEEIVDYIPYPTKDAEGLFALKVVGLSMRDAGILDGDIIVADKNAPCRSGDIIIGMDGDEATVKRLEIRKDGMVVFMPENPDFSPIYPEKPSVLGKVVGSYCKYQ